MIQFTYGKNLLLQPELAKSMFQDRAEQFSERLGWSVDVDGHGLERDVHDTLNPLYVIATDEDGTHLGSMRFHPSTGQAMLNDCFREYCSGPTIENARVWECTRFCLSPDAGLRTAFSLLAAGARLMRAFGMSRIVAVFDQRVFTGYRRSGVVPTTIGTGGHEVGHVTVGFWDYTSQRYLGLLELAQISSTEMELYVANSDILHQDQKYASSTLVD